jgi:capsular exopolysaccharide synthesis family protein
MDAGNAAQKTLWDYLQVVLRRKWLFLVPLVLGLAVSALLAFSQSALYQAQARILLDRQTVPDALSGTPNPSAYLQLDRFAQTQAEVAKSPEVALRTVRKLGLTNLQASDLLDAVSVAPEPGAEVLVVKVKNSDPSLALRLATEYARQYLGYRQQLNAEGLAQVAADVEVKLEQLLLSGDTSSGLYSELVSQRQQVLARQALQSPNGYLIQPAVKTDKVQWQPAKMILIGLVLGLLAGLGLVFLRDALDSRKRSAEALSGQLGLALLGRIPAPKRRLARRSRLIMLDDPNDARAEPFRMLRAKLELANLKPAARTIMATSAARSEGKSTTVANLAVALARGGHSVVLVDLDLRHPSLHRFFALTGRPGLTQVALGRARLTDATVSIALLGDSAGDNPRGRRERGSLEVVGTGPLPPNPGEFVGTESFLEVLRTLSARADIVLIDAPPLLEGGDALALSAKVDALFVVSRLKLASSPVVEELKLVLDSCPAQKLGYVATGADVDDASFHGYDDGNGYEGSDRNWASDTPARSDEVVEDAAS